ncbi:PKD domain-containing protein [Halorhabdus utahensis DSM 12940]|uniref:PKD domain-containing protein n=1 Tax=Halorhabdus utahensis (strain DSM 12940 / JCM 11049 / AX-2) TaxID=519442 RepID=C7NSX0_HALUD|nr:FG-GAP repeat protein [Halorhabdus utahensis]ACV10781.1 PKD domain-containing protein [Halorhabdus utahensis DSM 12940]
MTDRRRFLSLCSIAGTGVLAACISNREGKETQSRDLPTNFSETAIKSPTESPTPTTSLTETNEVKTQAAKVYPTDGDSGDWFGRSVAMSSEGATAIITTLFEEGTNGDGAGSAYIFETSGESWDQQARLTPDDGNSEDWFGRSVAMSSDGTTTIIGATGDEDPNGDLAGSAYVFEDNDNSWGQQAKLTPGDGDREDFFGVSAAVSSDGTSAIIGAHRDKNSNGEEAGSAYVFQDRNGSWSQQAKLTPVDGDSGNRFGMSVAMSSDGTRAIIGAQNHDPSDGEIAGSAYVFKADDGSWSQQAKLTPDDGESNDGFGSAAAVSGDATTAIISAHRDKNSNGEEAGSAYVFQDRNGSWSQQAKLTPDDGDSTDWFGSPVTLSSSGATAIIGASQDEDPNGEQAGSAYIFEANGGSWSQQAKLASADGDSGDRFGVSMAVSDDATTALIGAPHDEDPNGKRAGSAYVFTL